jgi:hypothetical protein
MGIEFSSVLSMFRVPDPISSAAVEKANDQGTVIVLEIKVLLCC